MTMYSITFSEPSYMVQSDRLRPELLSSGKMRSARNIERMAEKYGFKYSAGIGIDDDKVCVAYLLESGIYELLFMLRKHREAVKVYRKDGPRREHVYKTTIMLHNRAWAEKEFEDLTQKVKDPRGFIVYPNGSATPPEHEEPPQQFKNPYRIWGDGGLQAVLLEKASVEGFRTIENGFVRENRIEVPNSNPFILFSCKCYKYTRSPEKLNILTDLENYYGCSEYYKDDYTEKYGGLPPYDDDPLMVIHKIASELSLIDQKFLQIVAAKWLKKHR